MTGTLPLKPLRPTARRVLYALRKAGKTGVTTGALCQPDVGGIRHSARIHELREAGCVIFRVQLRPGSWRYWLVGPDPFERQMSRPDLPVDEGPQMELAA